MKITPEVLEALQRAVSKFPNRNQFALMAGIPQHTVVRWLDGISKSISDENYEKIFPLIRPYFTKKNKGYPLPWNFSIDDDYDGIKHPDQPSTPDTIRNTPELRECIKDAMLKEGVRDASELNRRAGYDSSHSLERLLAGKLNWFPDVLSAVLDALNIKHDDAPLSPAERGMLAPDGMYRDGGVLTRPIPVVDWANAATHIASLVGRNGEPVMKKWDPENTDIALAPVGVRRNTQAFRVHGVSMEPTIADGDILFCEEQYDLNSIPSGKIVIVCFSDDSEYAGTVVCKRLRRAGSILMLTSDNEKTGKDITVNSPGEIAWIGVVVRKSSEL